MAGLIQKASSRAQASESFASVTGPQKPWRCAAKKRHRIEHALAQGGGGVFGQNSHRRCCIKNLCPHRETASLQRLAHAAQRFRACGLQQRSLAGIEPCTRKFDQRLGIAIGAEHGGESCCARRFRGLRPHRVQREIAALSPCGKSADAVGAGGEHGLHACEIERRASDELHLHERCDDRRMAARPHDCGKGFQDRRGDG